MVTHLQEAAAYMLKFYQHLSEVQDTSSFKMIEIKIKIKVD
jgi:hypothetical protein